MGERRVRRRIRVDVRPSVSRERRREGRGEWRGGRGPERMRGGWQGVLGGGLGRRPRAFGEG